MSDIPLPEGISFFDPHAKAPDFVIGTISVNPVKFIQYLESQEADEKGYIKFQVLKSKKGTSYVKLDTWKPTAKAGTVKGEDGEDVPF